ncbi:ABC transporter substrate-binding protein [Microbacterium sp. Se5.02b]|uniref:ABC transporter substrate-binding protein n=1 Tax=Microbacterium sp. Se5.02b TaxID=2864103 RepID=UPI00215D643D|nr:ABC transporter substrate-binding protein [Microbacterium sp. Se5.02b]
MSTARRASFGALTATGVALALVITGCSAPASDPKPAEGAAGGDLVIGVTSDPDTLFPWKATQFQAVNVLQNLYGTLTEFDEELNVVPGLAESWDVSDDGLTVTFHLREGVTFADGSAFDSEDVKYSLDAIAAEATAAVASSSLASVTAVEATDATTVTLALSAPDAALPANLAVINMAMLSSDDTEEALNTTPNGTGPFILDDRKASQSITLAKNEDYWGDAALLDTVEFRVIPDESSIVSAMQSGNVQLAVFDDPLVAQTAEGANVEVATTPQLSYHALQLNATRGDLTDVNVRLAIQCAIDRQEVLDTAALGEGEVTGPITSPAYKSDPDAPPAPSATSTRPPTT